MSSTQVRESILDFLDTESAETVVDITAQFGEFREMLNEEGVQPDAPWLGIEFIGDEELPVSLSATNDQGLYREYGLIQLHICEAARLGAGAVIISRGEVLRNLFRGRRIEGVIIESVSPVNTGPGATLEFDGGYVSGTISLGYYYDVTL